jgi:bifunctional DNA-binding transcriptional regulator/antitoxin component of YhaV-PrlF toxin-antitoxin module
MGNEAVCRVNVGDQSAEAKVLLETDEVVVRGALKLRIPFREMEAVAGEGQALTFRWRGAAARLEVGAQAARWAEKIRNPKSVIDKLGIKPGQKVSIVGDAEAGLVAAVKARSGDVSRRLRKASDVILFATSRREELSRLGALREALTPAGAIWVIRPKGVASIHESEVMAAGKAAGLVDVKVMRVSETLTGEKFVIPVTKR